MILKAFLWNLQTGTSTSIDSRSLAPAIDVVHLKWIAALFTALKHERILMRQTHAQTAADKDYIVGFSLLGGACDGKMGSRERWMAAQGRACCISDVKVFPHMHYLKKDKIPVKVSIEACLQPFLPHSQPARRPLMAICCALDTIRYQEVSDGNYSTLIMTVFLQNKSAWSRCHWQYTCHRHNLI